MSKNWIQKAVKHPGSLRSELGVSKKTGNIPSKRINAAAKMGGKLGQRARFAKTMRKIREKNK